MKKSLTILVLIFVLSLCSIASAKGATVLTNHALLNNSNNFIVSFTGVGTSNYKSIDQFTSAPGVYNCEIQIIDNNTSRIIDSTNFIINAANMGDTATHTTQWTTVFPHTGFYSYQIVVDGTNQCVFGFMVK